MDVSEKDHSSLYLKIEDMNKKAKKVVKSWVSLKNQ